MLFESTRYVTKDNINILRNLRKKKNYFDKVKSKIRKDRKTSPFKGSSSFAEHVLKLEVTHSR